MKSKQSFRALVSMVLGHMVRKGQIRKLSKGRFYKLKIGKLGELPTSDYEFVCPVPEKKKGLTFYRKSLLCGVGVEGFELPTICL
jgi:hypothetical protein